MRRTSLLLAVAGIAAFTGCQRPVDPHPAPTAAATASASRPGADGPAWRPFDLGSYQRPVTTPSPEAQRAFNQGLIWAYAFNHDEAQRAFEEAVRLDPSCAMAYWGIALVNGPHINNPMVDEQHAKAAWDALQQARARAVSASPAERALIEALAARYAWPQPADRAPLDAAYARAMAGVRERFPDDADVATLYAEAMMDTRPWDQWTHDGRPQPGTAEVLAALEAAQAIAPDHPGALHLYVHALEASPHPERAAAAADRLRALVPDASHLVHMPSHIDARLGRWAEAAAVNERAIAADRRYAERQQEIDFYQLYMAHNVHFLVFTAMMEGRRAAALESAREITQRVSVEKARENPLFLDAFRTVEPDTYKRFGMWEEILALPQPPPELPVSLAFHHFARAIALAATGKSGEARHERSLFHAALPKVPKEAYWGSNLAAAVLAPAVPYLDGEIAYGEKDLDLAIAKLSEAVRLESSLKYDEPPPWTTPARHALGAVLLEANRPAEAEAVYRADLTRYPLNGWSLWGLERALEAQGREAEAAAVKAQFDRTWSRADTPMVSSCLCVKSRRG
jgi:tetratricopeptide (TPR) repeat protein